MGLKIVFVAEMRNPKTAASSTQIMTKNILHGFCEIADEVIFVPVLGSINDTEDINDFYSTVCKNIIFAIETSKLKNNVFGRQFVWLKNSIFPPANCVPELLKQHISEETVLVSQSPSVDSAVICKRIKKEFPTVSYIQYWGDPLALSLITPAEYSIKRLILKLIERNLHRSADKIVYGTESLFNAEIEIFPRLKNKATACRVSFMPEAVSVNYNNPVPVFGYFGNYYTKIRNLKPLYDAFNNIDKAKLVICGSSDMNFQSTDNISILDRVPQNQVEEFEKNINIEICVLNTVGVQIPGKIFYHTNTNKQILVITDGPKKNEIERELKESNRFIFCENNTLEIQNAVNKIISGELKAYQYDVDFYSPATVCRQIIDGYSKSSVGI